MQGSNHVPVRLGEHTFEMPEVIPLKAQQPSGEHSLTNYPVIQSLPGFLPLHMTFLGPLLRSKCTQKRQNRHSPEHLRSCFLVNVIGFGSNSPKLCTDLDLLTLTKLSEPLAIFTAQEFLPQGPGTHGFEM